MDATQTTAPRWLATGDAMFAAMLAAIDAARARVDCETYTFADDPLGRRFRAALTDAARRGARVRVLVDAMGSLELADAFWNELRAAGGAVRWFNPLTAGRPGIRNHRKLLVCDGRVAFIGGFNLAEHYAGDGVTRGWRDVGVALEGGLAAGLEATFEQMLALAALPHKRFPRLRRSTARRLWELRHARLLLGAPGRGPHPIHSSLLADLRAARDARVMTPYFLPGWRLRRALQRVVRRGGRVQLLLPGPCDVPIAKLAARSYYARLLRAGVELYEYQPRILHAKLFVVDDAAYAGSANFDRRSLRWNYELMVRWADPAVAAEARTIFAEARQHARRLNAREWQRSRTLWDRWRERWAYWILARLDPWMSRWQWRTLPE